jgi:hypothetical protein
VPRSLKIFAAIHLASGATPTELPPALPPTMTPIVCVPCPLMSVGVVGCCPLGSYQLLVPPLHLAARSGWVASTPVSMFATTTPWPRNPRSHSAGAFTSETLGSTVDVAAAATSDVGAWTVNSGRTSRTSVRLASSRTTAGVVRTATSLAIHSGTIRVARPCACRLASKASTPCWVWPACARRPRSTAARRAGRLAARNAPRFACDFITTTTSTNRCGLAAPAGSAGDMAMPTARASSRPSRLIARSRSQPAHCRAAPRPCHRGAPSYRDC